jgi:hypothetical protein
MGDPGHPAPLNGDWASAKISTFIGKRQGEFRYSEAQTEILVPRSCKKRGSQLLTLLKKSL